ncbi:hypothetical protein IWQ60_001398 [Tieghemiomyces parasiticus]|uniref:Transmembrane protein 198 n=1 Tax=Tieghemiomyces parasiticus TaxID=78921 RepID=A0A9W8AJY1_9FUNG|nr:hypothetical protein IWQ60_001398 [Tieghemiomyces parasiticus]
MSRWPLGPLRLWLCLAYILGIASTIYADPLPGRPIAHARDSTTQAEVSNKIGTIQIVIGIILLIFGLMFAFLGNRLFRVAMFASGFVYLGLGILLLCIRIKPPGDSTGRIIGYLVVAIVLGVVGGFLFASVWWLGLAGVGSLGGIGLAVLILSFKHGGLIPSPVGRGLFVAGLAVAMVLLIFFVEKYVVIISTAFFGALATFVGLDCFIKTGFRFILYLVLTAKEERALYETNSKVYGMIGGLLALFVVGSVCQFFLYREPIGIREYNMNWFRRKPREEKNLTEPEPFPA